MAVVGVQRVVMSAGAECCASGRDGRFEALPNFKFGSRGASKAPSPRGLDKGGVRWVQARGDKRRSGYAEVQNQAMASAKLEPSEPSASSSTPARPRLAILALSSGGDRHMAMRCFMRESIKSLLAPGADRPDRRRGAWTGVAGGGSLLLRFLVPSKSQLESEHLIHADLIDEGIIVLRAD